MQWRRTRSSRPVFYELNPDEILLDADNLPAFDTQQFEGRIERPIAKRTLSILLTGMIIIVGCFVGRLGFLQIARAAWYETKSEQNSLDHIPVFADRGVIYDRNGVELSWNSFDTERGVSIRQYIDKPGFASLVGYVSYPTKDAKGVYWQERMMGRDGIEKEFDSALSGTNGTKLIEEDVNGVKISESTIVPPEQGTNISLSIDARVQEALAQGILDLAQQSGYAGGAGAVMDIHTGELLAMTSLPEYSQAVLSAGKDTALIREYTQGSTRTFLNRMTHGLYTPGSIIKPFLALAALNEHIITPERIIVTTGTLKVPNPYNPSLFTVFKDNADHGLVDMKKAITVSSNIYFYEVGGGYGSQQGLGIANIEKYARLFGIGEKTGIDSASEVAGTVPSVSWKAQRFPGDPWRIGDTYNTSIGQYGFQVTPIQMLRAVAGIASHGTLVTPTLQKAPSSRVSDSVQLPFTIAQYAVVDEAMRAVVTEGTGTVLNTTDMLVAAKTGTAQIKGNTRVNSWVIGFFPADHPRFAFTVLMEDGPKVSTGATHAFRPVVDLFVSTPELLTQ